MDFGIFLIPIACKSVCSKIWPQWVDEKAVLNGLDSKKEQSDDFLFWKCKSTKHQQKIDKGNWVEVFWPKPRKFGRQK